MNIVLWVLQGLLALAFLGAGVMKLTQPIDKLKQNMAWIDPKRSYLVRVVGALEVLGAIGLIVPALTHILPILIPLAAAGLVITMIGAAIVHIGEKDYKGLSAPVVLLILALIVVIGRFALVPLS